jgi:hypothetical protein
MKLAVVCSGWHFPWHFYNEISKQKTKNIDLFCVLHRDPIDDKNICLLGNSMRERMDKILYDKIISVDEIRELGWDYKLYPNTIGDWGCSNQWLEDHDYTKYDRFLFIHDDNLVTNKHFLKQAFTSGNWEILANSEGMPEGWIRGSCAFFKKSMLDKLGGKFDVSMTKLRRVGLTDTPKNLTGVNSIDDWNKSTTPLVNFIKENNIVVKRLSPYYRVSKYLIEGERGFISWTHKRNTAYEEEGLDVFYRNFK